MADRAKSNMASWASRLLGKTVGKTDRTDKADKTERGESKMKDKDKKKASASAKKAAPKAAASKASAPAKSAASKAASAAKPSSKVLGKAPAKAAVVPLAASKKANVKAAAAPVKAGKAAPAPITTAAVIGKGKKGSKPTSSQASSASSARNQAMVRAGLLPAEGSTICREVACESSPTSSGYCRLHYIKNWKRIKKRELLLKEGKLNRYIEELVAKYPEKYIEAIRQDLTTDADFAKVVTDLELDEGIDEFDSDSENIEGLIDSIRKDLDDETDIY